MELRKCGVSDTNVLTAIEKVPREHFVPEAFKARAYDNIALPIDASQTISQPQVVAEMTTALELEYGHKVLEVGTGSGYQAAVLANLCKISLTKVDLPDPDTPVTAMKQPSGKST